jgi:hypothetical protein
LVAELVGRLRSANSDGHVRSDSRLTADPFPSGCGTSNTSRSSDDGLSDRRMDEAN